MVIRMTDISDEAEVLEVNKISNQEYFLSVPIKDIAKKINEYVSDKLPNTRAKPFLLNPSVIGASADFSSILINQPEHVRIVTYKDKAYKIHFPNALYIMYQNSSVVNGIKAFAYKHFDGMETKLYRYPMPNMLSDNMICIGSAPRKISDCDYVKALENIIFTQYTHDTVNNIRSFKSTVDYFTYLSANVFPYHLLIADNKTLKDIANGQRTNII